MGKFTGPSRPAKPKGALTFNDWLRHAHATKDPVGDLVRDARGEELPPIRSEADLHFYLVRQRACQECLDIVPEAWARFENWRSEHLNR